MVLMRTDPFRELDRLSQQVFGTAARPAFMPMDAWREGDTDYATVAMKFVLKDSMIERASGRTVEGGERSEVTELWTFTCARVAAIGSCRPSSRLDGPQFVYRVAGCATRCAKYCRSG